MKNPERAAALLAGLGFVMLFPGFFLYHSLLGLGHIRAFLGGYFGVCSVALAGPMLWWHVRAMRRTGQRPHPAELAMWFFLAYFVGVVLIHAAAGANWHIVQGHLLSLFFWIDVFVIFRWIDFGARRLRTALLLCLAGMSLTIFYYQVDGTFYLGILGLSSDPDSVATYQGFSRSYLFTCLPLVAFSRARAVRMLIYAIAVPTLYLNSARTEFIGLLLAASIIEICFARFRLAAVATALAAGAILWIAREPLIGVLPDNRTLELLDLSQSTSAALRHELGAAALQTITQHPLLGAYASYEPGDYAHNLLSAWVDFGLFGVVYFSCMMLAPTLDLAVGGFFRQRRDPQFIHGFTFACVTVMMLLMSHYFDDMLVPATLGAYVRYSSGARLGPVPAARAPLT
jgi:hypothetical protein